MVAPNSPMARAKQRMAPAMMPGRDQRQRHGEEHVSGLAPSVAAACSSLRSTASTESWMARTISGKPMMAQASAAPVQRKANTMPRCASSQRAERALPAEQQQQHIARHHRRQHQRQQHQRVEQRAPVEAAAGQDHGHENAKREARHRRQVATRNDSLIAVSSSGDSVSTEGLRRLGRLQSSLHPAGRAKCRPKCPGSLSRSSALASPSDAGSLP